MFEWHKKEKPVFTGIARGVGGFGFGGQRLIPVSSAASNTGGVAATGGAIFEYTDSGSTYRIHVFANSNETFTYTSGPGSVDVLVVGGGGAGGRTAGDQDTGKGGGGAGGVAWAYQIPVSPGTTCPVTIGSGGTGSAQSPTGYASRPAAVVHQSGSPSTFIIPSGPYTITGAGGGGGGVSDTGPNPIAPPNTNAGDPGGSGGGAAARSTGSTFNGGPATQPAQNPGMPWVSNYGYVGGFSNNNPDGSGGGGGGAGGQGTDSPGSGNGGSGGPGISNFINSSTSQTSAFLIAAHIGTDPNNAQVTPSSPAVSYIGGGGGGGTGCGGPDWTTSQGPGGVGGGGRAGAGRNVGQTGPTNSLLPNAYWPVVRGLEHTGSGGGGAADDPTNYTTASYAGSGGKGVVIVRYSITSLSTGTFIAATGGSVSTSGNYKIHTFSHPNSPALSNYTGYTFDVTSLSNAPVYNTIEVLCVGGGGSGGMWYGAGGGGGGVAYTYNYPLPGAGSVPLSIPIQVGGGGAAIPANPGTPGYPGGDSYFGPVSLRWTALGGGGGGYGGNGVGGNPGGSGGGGGGPMNPGSGQGGRSTQKDVVTSANPNIVGYNYGNAGGNGAGPSGDAGGGGGAGSSGSPNGGNGGNGVAISITGSSVTYGGGGGGANPGNSATGGSGGGGNGGGPSNGGDGTNGLGGAGGGAYTGASRSGQGGSGVVIVRYRYQ